MGSRGGKKKPHCAGTRYLRIDPELKGKRAPLSPKKEEKDDAFGGSPIRRG